MSPEGGFSFRSEREFTDEVRSLDNGILDLVRLPTVLVTKTVYYNFLFKMVAFFYIRSFFCENFLLR